MVHLATALTASPSLHGATIRARPAARCARTYPRVARSCCCLGGSLLPPAASRLAWGAPHIHLPSSCARPQDHPPGPPFPPHRRGAAGSGRPGVCDPVGLPGAGVWADHHGRWHRLRPGLRHRARRASGGRHRHARAAERRGAAAAGAGGARGRRARRRRPRHPRRRAAACPGGGAVPGAGRHQERAAAGC